MASLMTAAFCHEGLSSGWRMKKTWKFPSPTWPRIGANSPDAWIIVSARDMASANREMGEPVPVLQYCGSGTIDLDAPRLRVRAVQSKIRSPLQVQIRRAEWRARIEVVYKGENQGE